MRRDEQEALDNLNRLVRELAGRLPAKPKRLRLTVYAIGYAADKHTLRTENRDQEWIQKRTRWRKGEFLEIASLRRGIQDLQKMGVLKVCEHFSEGKRQRNSYVLDFGWQPGSEYVMDPWSSARVPAPGPVSDPQPVSAAAPAVVPEQAHYAPPAYVAPKLPADDRRCEHAGQNLFDSWCRDCMRYSQVRTLAINGASL